MHDYCKKYFDEHNPDVVFSTSVAAKFDIEVMKEAHKRGIKTVSMPRVWDNITTKFYRFVPDKLLVQNKLMKRGAYKYQNINPEKVSVCGFPQFDWYRRKDILQSREDFFRSINLDPGRKLIVYGSSTVWSPDDISNNTGKLMIDMVQSKERLITPSSLLIRAHFSNAHRDALKHFKNMQHVRVDSNFSITDFFLEKCDPNTKEIIQFVNTLYHADVVVVTCSTLALDAICLDTPVVNLAFMSAYDKFGKDVSYIMYNHDHYQPIMKIKATDLAYSEEELVEQINNCLLHPEHKREERKKVLDILCYKVDGKSSERIANEVLKMI